MATASPNRGFVVPTPSSDIGLWGTELNATISDLDNILGGTLSLYSSNSMNVTLATSQAQFGRIAIAGAFSTTFVLNFPQTGNAFGEFLVSNFSSAGGYGVVCQSTGSGTQALIPQGQTRSVFSDGTNVFFADSQTLPLVLATINFNISGGGGNPPAAWYGAIKVPYTFQASSYTIMSTSDAQGSAQVDIYHGISSAYPSMSSEARLSLSSAYINSGPYGPVTYTQNDLMGFLLFSSTSLTSVNIAISGTRSLSS